MNTMKPVWIALHREPGDYCVYEQREGDAVPSQIRYYRGAPITAETADAALADCAAHWGSYGAINVWQEGDLDSFEAHSSDGWLLATCWIGRAES